MSTGLFGPRGPSYPYSPYPRYPTHYSRPVSPYSYPYPNQTHLAYPNVYHNSNNLQYLYPGQLQDPTLNSYSWNQPRVFLLPKNLETILIAILILVVLDQIYIRPLKKLTD